MQRRSQTPKATTPGKSTSKAPRHSTAGIPAGPDVHEFGCTWRSKEPDRKLAQNQSDIPSHLPVDLLQPQLADRPPQGFDGSALHNNGGQEGRVSVRVREDDRCRSAEHMNSRTRIAEETGPFLAFV